MSLSKKGYRLVLVDGYGVGNKAYYAAIWEKKTGPAMIARHGLTSAKYQDLTPGIRDSLDIPRDLGGVMLTSVSPTSPLYDEGVREGDVIVEVNRRKVEDVEAFESFVDGAEAGSFLNLYVMRFDPNGRVDPVGRFAFVRVP